MAARVVRYAARGSSCEFRRRRCNARPSWRRCNCLESPPSGDKDNTLWFSSSRIGYIGRINTRKFLETGDEAAAQGWAPIVLDTNGNGQRDAWAEPNQPLDPAKDKRLNFGVYGIGYDPTDGSVWGSVLSFPGGVLRIIPGANPPETTLAEYYEAPFNEPRVPVNGYAPRGFDIDRNGVAWVPLSSGHLASFDRKKCKGPLNGPTVANGRHCPEGWTLHQFPGPQFENVSEPGAVQSSYYTSTSSTRSGLAATCRSIPAERLFGARAGIQYPRR